MLPPDSTAFTYHADIQELRSTVVDVQALRTLREGVRTLAAKYLCALICFAMLTVHFTLIVLVGKRAHFAVSDFCCHVLTVTCSAVSDADELICTTKINADLMRCAVGVVGRPGVDVGVVVWGSRRVGVDGGFYVPSCCDTYARNFLLP